MPPMSTPMVDVARGAAFGSTRSWVTPPRRQNRSRAPMRPRQSRSALSAHTATRPDWARAPRPPPRPRRPPGPCRSRTAGSPGRPSPDGRRPGTANRAPRNPRRPAGCRPGARPGPAARRPDPATPEPPPAADRGGGRVGPGMPSSPEPDAPMASRSRWTRAVVRWRSTSASTRHGRGPDVVVRRRSSAAAAGPPPGLAGRSAAPARRRGPRCPGRPGSGGPAAVAGARAGPPGRPAARAGGRLRRRGRGRGRDPSRRGRHRGGAVRRTAHCGPISWPSSNTSIRARWRSTSSTPKRC